MMRRIKGFNPIQLLIVLVILMMTSILALQGSGVRAKLEELQAATHDNVQWNLAQIEVELLMFLNALVTAQATPEDAVTLDIAKRRFKIFFSHVQSINNDGNLAELNANPSFAESMDAITTALKNATALIDANPAVLRAELGTLSRDMTALRNDARNLAWVGVNSFANKSDAQRADFANLLEGTARTAFLLFIAMLVAIYMMLHQRRLATMRARAARESRSRYISTIDASLDAIIVADADGKILEFNPAAEKTFGYSRARAIGTDMSELIVPERMREAHRAGMKRFRENGESLIVGKGRVELNAIDASGREFPIEISIGTAASASDEAILIYNIRDISQRKKIEGELLDARDSAQAADRAKSRFLAVTSHEMRTPLNGVMGVLDLLSTTKLTRTQRDYLETAVTSGEILQHHIDTVLDITRIEAGAIELKPQRFNIHGLLQEVYQSYAITADKNWNTIELLVEDGLDYIVLDRNRLRQILLNLVGNALKFTEYGLVRIHAWCDTDQNGRRLFKLTVSDTGCGIAPENIDRIFDDFVTLDASYGRKTNGYGLGLSICRRISSAMGGEIAVFSTLKKGTVFTIQLPEANAVDMPHEEKSNEVISQDTYDLDVLIVEDNETNRLIASAMLEQFGCRVTLAVDGEDGLAAAASNSFDLVFMDLSMPKMDGLEAVERIRAESIIDPEVPIVFLTAHAMQEEEERMRAAGVEHVLMKPLRRRNLASLLQKLFGEQADDGTGRNVTKKNTLSKKAHGVDFAFIEEMRDLMDPAEVSAAIENFCGEVTKGISSLEALNKAGDLEGARILAHRICGSSAMFGGLALADALRTVQNLAHSGDKEQIKEMMPEIVMLSEGVVDAFRKEAANS